MLMAVKADSRIKTSVRACACVRVVSDRMVNGNVDSNCYVGLCILCVCAHMRACVCLCGFFCVWGCVFMYALCALQSKKEKDRLNYILLCSYVKLLFL